MPIISFLPHKNIKPIEVEPGANLMESLIKAEMPVASSCLGNGICGKCRVNIIAGQNNLAPYSDLEKQLRDKIDISETERLSCQTVVVADLCIDTQYW